MNLLNLILSFPLGSQSVSSGVRSLYHLAYEFIPYRIRKRLCAPFMSNTAGPDVVHPSLRQLQLSANMLENASDRESGGSESDGEGMLNRVKRDFPTDKISSTIPVKTGNNSEDAPVMPIQKRRRVTRACDECRRKKIKCDGKQPCTHCQIYNYGR